MFISHAYFFFVSEESSLKLIDLTVRAKHRTLADDRTSVAEFKEGRKVLQMISSSLLRFSAYPSPRSEIVSNIIKTIVNLNLGKSIKQNVLIYRTFRKVSFGGDKEICPNLRKNLSNPGFLASRDTIFLWISQKKLFTLLSTFFFFLPSHSTSSQRLSFSPL